MDEELNNENIAALNQSLQDLQRLMQQQTGLLRQQNQLAFLQLNASERAKIKLDEFGQTVAEDDKILEAHIKQIELTNQRMAALRGAFDSATMGAKSLFNALTEASGGVAKYKGALDGLGGIFDNLIKGFGPQNQALNFGLQSASKALFGLSGLVLEQTQYMIKSMDTVAGMGVTSNITSNQLRLLGEKAGYSWTNLEKFAAITAKAGRDLLAMGGSTSAGVVAFTRFTAIGDDQYKKYRALGFEQEQVTELMRELASIQIRSGQATGRGAGAMDRLQNSTLKLIDNMLALADITGLSIEEQKKGLDFAAQNRNFQFFAARESMKAAELRQQGTPQAEQEAALIEARAASKRLIAGIIEREFGQQIATGFLQRAAGTRTGALTEQSTQLELLLREQGGARKFIDAINNALSPEDAQKAGNNLRAALLSATQRQIQVGKAYEGLGAAELEYQETFGVFEQGVATVVANLDPDKAKQTVEQLGVGFNNQFDNAMNKLSALTNAQGQFIGKANDNIMNASAQIAAFERYATLQLATIVASMNPLIGNSTQAATKLLAVSIAAGAAAAALAIFARRLLRTPTTTPPVPGAPGAPGTPGSGGKIEKRTDSRGRDYYVDTETGKRVSKEAGEAAEAERRRGRFRIRPGTAMRGAGGILASVATPYLVDAMGGEGTTGGALTNILAQTGGMAATGSMFGPYGTAIGGALGLGMGLYSNGGTLLKNLFGGGGSSTTTGDLSNLQDQSTDQHEENLEMLEAQLGIGQDQVDEMQRSANLAFQQLQELTRIGDGISSLGQQMQADFSSTVGAFGYAGGQPANQDLAQMFIDQGGSITKDKVTEQGGRVLWSADDPVLKSLSEKMKTEMRYLMTSELQAQYNKEKSGTAPAMVAGANAQTQDFATWARNFESNYVDRQTGMQTRPTVPFKTGTDAFTGMGGSVAQGNPVAPTSPGLSFNTRGEFVKTGKLPGMETSGSSMGGTSLIPGDVDLTSITSKSGASASVDRKFQNQFQGLVNELEASGYKISRIDGYNKRKVAGTDTWSSHAYGAAIDINPLKNMPGQQGDLPFNAGQIAAKYGLGWGATFRTNPDPMHFSATAREGGSFQARYGAMLEGPMSGYNPDVTFHGSEIIAPAPRDSILQKYFTETATTENKPAVSSDIEALMNTQNNTFRELLRVQSEQYSKQQMVVDRLETIAETLKSSERTQTDILRYTRS